MNLDHIKLQNKIEKKQLETIKITIEGKEYDLEVEKYHFEYPKHIQEETGILGYERKNINNGQLFSILCDFFKEINIDLSDVGIDSLDKWNKNADLSADDINKIVLPMEHRDMLGNLIVSILSRLSENEYPMCTINHQLSGYSLSDDITNQHRKDFITDKFFLQKIYGERLLKSGNYNFHHSDVDFVLFNKKDNGYIPYQEMEKDKNYFKISGNTGLNISAGSFFRNAKLISFGLSEDKFFKNYCHNLLKLYSELSKKTPDNEGLSKGMQEIATILVFNQEFVKDYIKLFFNRSEELVDYTEVLKKIKGLMNKLSHQYEFRYNENECDANEGSAWNFDYLDKDLRKFRAFEYQYLLSNVFEMKLPIIINHDKIPQLSWGHAKYAHYMNEKGLNFFEFKHADHLPTKHNKTAE